MSQAIVLLSHGSVLCGAGEALQDLARRMRADAETPIVEAGFLNYSTPTFESAFGRCLDLGATSVVVVPYFLVPGKFVQVDLPRAVARVSARYPEVEIRLAAPMGRHPALASALVACARRAVPLPEWRRAHATAARSCRADPRCPLYGRGACAATVGKPIG